jgi:hypothetical protein
MTTNKASQPCNNTGKNPPARDEQSGRFLPGNNGGPGRPRGSRHRLSEDFLSAIADDFTVHGIEAIKRVREEDPCTYIRVVASLLPKEIKADVSQRFVARLPAPAETIEEWQRTYSPVKQ